ncbi:MAG: hypothetical protein PVJ47_00005 [Thiohalocapsa sp.]|jgi:hypothetical protein|uniref:hypothetical protein n=1 Tax=Thiohalocapsa sp. TaxID=2497641 RepID=UPI0025E7759A|nr:hypothetical protein [Thiohalocapsa sp.]
MEDNLSPEHLKQTLKDALVELLHEEPDVFRQAFAEALEDAALSEAIREGQATEPVDRDAIFDLLEARD